MTKEDLDALEQVLQDHGNDGSYPFLVDLKRMSGGWYFKSWKKNGCPAYLAIVEEHYYVEENSETSVLRAPVQQHQSSKSSSFQGQYLSPSPSPTTTAGLGVSQSQPKSRHLRPDLTRQRSSHSLIRNQARQSSLNTRGIQDVSDMLTLDEDSSDEDSLSSREYRLFSIQPLAKDSSNWVRCSVREEPLGTNEILERIRQLDSDKTSVIDKKLSLRADQQAQVTRVHTNVVTTETNPSMYWLLRQLQVMQKETSFFWKRGEDSGILVIFAREPRPGFEYTERPRHGSSTTTVAATNANENNLSRPMEEAAPLPLHSMPVPLTAPNKEAHSPSIRSFEKKTELEKDTAAADTGSIDFIRVDVDPERKTALPEYLKDSVSRRSRSRSKPSRTDRESTARRPPLSRVSTNNAGDGVYESRNMLSRARSRVPSPSRSWSNELSKVRYDAYSAGRKHQEIEDEAEKREQSALERYYGQVDARREIERASYWQPEAERSSFNERFSRRPRESIDGLQRGDFDNEVRNEVLVIRALEHRQGKAAERLQKARTVSEAEEARLDLNMNEDLSDTAAYDLARMELQARDQARYPTHFDNEPYDPKASSPGPEGDAIDQLLLTWTPGNDAVDDTNKAGPISPGLSETSEQSDPEQQDDEVTINEELPVPLPANDGQGSQVGSLDSPVIELDSGRPHVETTSESPADLAIGSDAVVQTSEEEACSPEDDNTHSGPATQVPLPAAESDGHHMHTVLDADKDLDNDGAGSDSVEHEDENEIESIDKSRNEAETLTRAHQETMPQDPATSGAQDHLDRARRLVRSTAIRSDPGDVEEERRPPAVDDVDGVGRPSGFQLPRKARTWDTHEPQGRDSRAATAEEENATRSEVVSGSERRRRTGGELAIGNAKKLEDLTEPKKRSLSRQKEEDEYDLGAYRGILRDLNSPSRASQSVRFGDRGETTRNAPEEVIRPRSGRIHRDAVEARRRRRATEEDAELSRKAREEQLEIERHRRQLTELRLERRRLEEAYAMAEEREREARARRRREEVERAGRLGLGLELGLDFEDAHPDLDRFGSLRRYRR
ncbi:hypothetical protein INS49_004229 [Diaporthe citri]|uniref:uncharacterized protein n=1 Tax=Diaporthe citri TaxID=83186 RepID=UPI001C7E88E1|nr:uncharacterized protein INS49_004229 [Diaporthe citri]KAG6355148.1 hypothetical protein INS49_004229 [Diaporthe citri]